MPSRRTKTLKKSSAVRSKRRRVKSASPSSLALTKVALPPAPVVHWRERRLSAEKVELLKRTVAKGTDNDQFELFLSVCQRHGLDPFVKQVYCVLWPVSKHHQDAKGIWLP